MIEFKHVVIDDKYRKYWNINSSLNDFLVIYKDGKKLRDTLYRIGGIGGTFKDGYIAMLKHTEGFYTDDITKIKKDKPHLSSQWCIIDSEGNEKVVLIEYRYISMQGGVIYSTDNRFYNIETGALYCLSYSHMRTKNYIFLNNESDKDESKRGVLMINKFTGTFELIQ